MKQLVIATRNNKKLIEIQTLMGKQDYCLKSLEDFGIFKKIEETGHTFEENAIIKAAQYGKITGILTIADDSGLEVDALNGAPGVYSARYGGLGKNDSDRNAYLLENLKGKRNLAARFTCVVALWQPGLQQTKVFEGIIEGVITEPKGDHGFGYDPLFYYPPIEKTFGEISIEEKHRISHRGKAIEKAVEYLQQTTL